MDDLDQLISDALSDDDASGTEPVDEPTPDGEEATEPEADGEETEPEAADPATDDDAEPSDDQPEETPDGTGQQESTAVPGTVDVETLRRENELTKRILANLVTAKQRQEQEAARQQAEAEEAARVEALKQQWAEMDPEEAAKSQAAYIAQTASERINALEAQLQQLEAEKVQSEQAREEAAAKEKVIPLIIEKFGLKESDRRWLSKLNDPYAMEEVAAELKAERAERTAAARQAKAEKAKANPALKPTEPSQSAPVFKQEHENIDELLDSLFP